MLTNRQQHCLQGIGIRRWRDRSASEAPPVSQAVSRAISPPASPPTREPVIDEVLDNRITSAPPAPAYEHQAVTSPIPAAVLDETPAPVTRREIEIPTLDGWGAIDAAIEQCEACELSQNCTQKVPGVGNREASLMIVGEGPGQDEDIRGEPFVGRSGKLLDRMLQAIGIAREDVFITNIVKCRPPNNRDPKVDEAQQCRVYLDAQIKQIAPKVILSVGRVSAHNLLGSKLPVGKLIQQMHQLPDTDIPVKVTYHPAYLLRSPAAKAIAWQDMKLLHRLLQ
jgi:uracil-DNA glycosylase family 4